MSPSSPTRPPRTGSRQILAAFAVLIPVLAACGGTGSPMPSPSSRAPTATATVEASSLPTPGPTSRLALVNVRVVTPETPLALLWEKAGPVLTEGTTSAVAVAPDGRVYAISAHDGVIWVFKPDGTYVKSIGSPGKGPGQFTFADDRGNVWGWIAFAPDGSYYVTDTFNNRVEAFDKADKFVNAFGSFGTGDGQFASPVGIALDPSSNVYVADGTRGDIQEFSHDGTFIKRFATGVDFGSSQAPAITIDPSGNVFAAVGRSIYKYDPTGVAVAVFNVMAYGYPDGFVADGQGNLWIPTDTTSNGNAKPGPLLELDPTGAVLHVFPPTGDLAALDPTGHAIYMTYFQAAPVEKYALP